MTSVVNAINPEPCPRWQEPNGGRFPHWLFIPVRDPCGRITARESRGMTPRPILENPAGKLVAEQWIVDHMPGFL